MRHLVIAGWILLITNTFSGCASGPEGMRRLAMSMGTKVEGPFHLPPDYRFPEIEEDSRKLHQDIVDPFLEADPMFD